MLISCLAVTGSACFQPVCEPTAQSGSGNGPPGAASCTGGYGTALRPGNVVPVPTDLADLWDAGASGGASATLSGTRLSLSGNYGALTGPATAAHIHTGSTTGAGPVACSLTVVAIADGGSGTMGGNCDGIVVTDLNGETLYLDLHTATNPGGEIRGQLYRR